MTQADQANNPELKEYINLELAKIRKMVEENAQRVAELGQWPAYIKPGSLPERIPKSAEEVGPGFDAGVACALDLIPGDMQELAAKLHANYSKDAVLQIRSEEKENSPDSQTTWWLAASSVCKEGETDGPTFLQQIEDFKKIIADEKLRLEAAKKEFDHMSKSFDLKDGVPYGEKDGCVQGAYIVGYPFGTEYKAKYDLYFIGTYEDSLGLEDFEWSQDKDEKGRAKSGPVSGSKQFVKCASEDEFHRALEVVKTKLPFDKQDK